MADTVPVRDVLNEAMEYLSKLGSNLRVRSENLKEKRLRKDKLRNSHAIQKTASKVLLICELSKKSIENVETGVKNVLTQIVATQASGSDGGKITSHKSSNVDNDIKYEYFNYKSRKLKIRNKVNLKHFTSVKVVAKAMSTEFHENYSVFYDCKLYRERKKKMFAVESSNNISWIEQKEPDTFKPVTTINEVPEQGKKGEVSDAEGKDNEASTSILTNIESEPKHNDKDNISKSKTCNKNESKKFKHITCHNDSSDSENGMENSLEKVFSKIQVECETASKDCSSPNINTVDENMSGTLTTNLIEVENISSINLTDSIPVLRNDDMYPEDKQSDVSLNNNGKVSTKSDSDDEVNNSAKNNKVTLCTSNKTDNTNIADVFDNHNSNSENIEKETCKQNFERNDTSQSSSDSKPFLKCVNINKLLKDVNIHIVESDSEEDLSVKSKQNKADANKKKHQYKHNERKPLKAGKKFKSEKHTKTNDNKDYWKLKRNEVKQFKAKPFCINVTRLPILSQEYLYKHNLKKVIQNGSIVCEYIEPTDDGSNKDEIECEKSISTTSANASTATTATTTTSAATTSTLSVKNSLLNDSDSDDNENLKNMVDNLSRGLVIESERNSSNVPDTNDNIENNSLADRSKSKTPDPIIQCNTNNEIFKSPQNDQIKKFLLNDSTDENSPNKKRKNESDICSPPSKRKHIMESMHAKKMLLTYSSSSDTDDEELKGALKQIRDYLLKGNSSDDEHKEDKTMNGPSESDASSVCLKRKLSRDRSVSSHDDISKDKKVSESESSTKKTSSQTEDNIDEKSTSSSKKVRSK